MWRYSTLNVEQQKGVGDTDGIKERRRALGMTQGDLAALLSADRTTVAKWELGQAAPRAGQLPQLAKVLGCTIDELYGKEE